MWSSARRMVMFILTGSGLALAGAALAAEGPAGPGGEAPDLLSAGFKMVGALILVIAVLLLTLYLLRRLGLARAGYVGGSSLIRIIATRPVAPRKYIVLVEIGDTVLTLGITNEHISCLDKTAAATFHACQEKAVPEKVNGSFAEKLKKHLAVRPPQAPSE